MTKIRVFGRVDLVGIKDKTRDNLFGETESMEKGGIVFKAKVSSEDEEGFLVNFLSDLSMIKK